MASLLYGCETWAPTRREREAFGVTQRAIVRRMVGVHLSDRISNEELSERSQVADAEQQIKLRKFKWAGHVARMDEERWAHEVTWKETIKRGKRPSGNPPNRWIDEITEHFGRDWKQKAQNRDNWR